jgi:hypothetical protein
MFRQLLTLTGASGIVPPMSEGGDPKKKHRHDVGAPDHGPVSTDPLTRSIQGLLLLLIAASLALAVYAVALAIG